MEQYVSLYAIFQTNLLFIVHEILFQISIHGIKKLNHITI